MTKQLELPMENVGRSLLDASMLCFDEYVRARAQGESPMRPETVTMYRHRMNKLGRFLALRGRTFTSASQGDLEAFIVDLGESATTVTRYLALLRDVCQSHEALEGVEPGGPSQGRLAAAAILASDRYRFIHFRAEQAVPTTLSKLQLSKVMHYLVTPPESGDWKSLRNWALFAMILGAGLRPGQAYRLRLKDLRYANGNHRLALISEDPVQVAVPGDGLSEAHVAPLAPYAASAVRVWLNAYDRLRRVDEHGHELPLFPGTAACKSGLAKANASRAFNEIAHELGCKIPETSLLVLRNTFAVRQLDAGVDPTNVQRWMAIKDPTKFERYKQLSKRHAGGLEGEKRA
jgi:site-specific recombinase XerD